MAQKKELDFNTVFEPNMRDSRTSYLYFTGHNINQNIQNNSIRKIDTLINEINDVLDN